MGHRKIYSPHKDINERLRVLREFAKAQDQMAANTTEDREFWHHVALRDVLQRAATDIEFLLRSQKEEVKK